MEWSGVNVARSMSQGDDPRLGDLLVEGDCADIVLVGFPCDEGVRRNGGRVGARHGPAQFRARVRRTGALLNRELQVDLRVLSVADAGDVETHTLEISHEALRKKVATICGRQAHSCCVVIGGGNDQSFPNACGLFDALPEDCHVCVINIDAHLDVRPLNNGMPHSGSPFRQLLESEFSHRLTFCEFACQGSQCAASHVDYCEEHNVKIHWLSSILKDPIGEFQKCLDDMVQEAREGGASEVAIFVSFDIDSIRASDCPGVSCPSSIGLTADHAYGICNVAGGNPLVRLLDFSEYNPDVEDYMTGKLVANLFYQFCCGRATLKRD